MLDGGLGVSCRVGLNYKDAFACQADERMWGQGRLLDGLSVTVHIFDHAWHTLASFAELCRHRCLFVFTAF